MEHEVVLTTRRIYAGRIVNLRVDDVRTPDGYETIREIVEHPGAVALVVIDDSDNVLLVKQYRHAVRRITTEIPAGTLAPGEDPAVAAPRELEEETGYTAARFERIGGVHPSPGFCTEYIHLFVVTGLTHGTPHPEVDEEIEVEHVPWAEALRRVRAGEIYDAKSVSALLLADALRRAA
ncbi:MAG TPA: NUDIX hydrolase [Anaerolineae bacterium]|nr:NUDIX hydrolase [Anaerolineae bacterium]